MYLVSVRTGGLRPRLANACANGSGVVNDMDNLVRREIIDTARTLVIKIGTNVLSRPDDTLDVDRIAVLAEQLHRVKQSGRQVVVVSSGAIGAGIGLLELAKRT